MRAILVADAVIVLDRFDALKAGEHGGLPALVGVVGGVESVIAVHTGSREDLFKVLRLLLRIVGDYDDSAHDFSDVLRLPTPADAAGVEAVPFLFLRLPTDRSTTAQDVRSIVGRVVTSATVTGTSVVLRFV